MSTGKARSAGGLFCVTVFVSAFLIFQVQPLVSKFILPWFGGTPGVWSACLLFFQTVLFAGYAYAHFSIQRFRPRTQATVHLLLLGLAAACLPIIPDASWKPDGHENPTWRILSLLAMTVGLPYFVLSATGPLLQAWFGRTETNRSPYRLYALSNLGSVLGLVTYPFLFEPLLDATAQSGLWSAAFVLFGAACGWCAIRSGRVPEIPREAAATGSPQAAAPALGDKLLWIGLSAGASVILLATTNQVCLDVAVIPFLWVLPLSLYLLSFILVFDSERWYPRGVYTIAMAVSVGFAMLMTYQSTQLPILPQLVIYFATLFFCCMVCHGELVRLKPAPQYLTSFYLATAAGGAAGGIFVGLLAPMLFERLIELQLGLIGSCACLVALHRRRATDRLMTRSLMWSVTCLLISGVGLLRLLASSLAAETERAVSRNFFGVLKVIEEHSDNPRQHCCTMIHGQTRHGIQFISSDKLRCPTTYYGETSGIGRTLHAVSRADGRRIGCVGLGIGTLAAYGQPNDELRFYEIDPDVVRLAKEHFSYLRDCPAHVDIVLGDARLSLERETPQDFDVLVLDAFSSDAIPVHLLTREAMEIYLRHLRADGVLAIHISNRFFDLEPIVVRLGEEFGLRAERIENEVNEELGQYSAHWMLLSREADFWNRPAIRPALRGALGPLNSTSKPRGPLWTDQFSNLLGILK